MGASALQALIQLDDALGLSRLGFVAMHADVRQALEGGVCSPAQATCHCVEPAWHIPYPQVKLRQRLVPSGATGRWTRRCVHMLLVAGLQRLMVSSHRHWLESDVNRPLAQGAHDSLCLLLTRCPRSLLTCGQHMTSERHPDMARILLNLLQDCTHRVV